MYTQLYPPKPTLTEANLPNQSGKVFLVTGGNAGVGYELVKILYCKGAKVYMAARSEAKASEAIESIKAISTSTPGEVKFLLLDLADLSTIKASAETFSAQEEKLDVLWNNAGVSGIPSDQRSKQGNEMHMAINCLGPFLLTQLLLPKLELAARTAAKNTVRTIWTSSGAVDAIAPQGGVDMGELSNPSSDANRNYAASKAGNWLLASEFAKRVGGDGIVSLITNPGQLRTKIWKGATKFIQIMLSPTLHPPIYGAYTNIWAGLSKEITVKDGGRYVIPWGRRFESVGTPRKDILNALKTKEEGGSGRAAEFWTWCEERTRKYA